LFLIFWKFPCIFHFQVLFSFLKNFFFIFHKCSFPFQTRQEFWPFNNSDITYNPLSKKSATFTRLNIYPFIFLSPLSQTCHNFEKSLFLGKQSDPQKGIVSRNSTNIFFHTTRSFQMLCAQWCHCI
jgi:hypothetical protein